MARTARKEKEVDHIRSEILRAAARAAARTGLDALTIKDIAKETGYTVGTLYTYFDGKEAIVQGLVQQLIEIAEDTLRLPMPKGLTFRQKVELLAQRQLTLAEEWRDGIYALLAVVWGGSALPAGINVRIDLHESVVKWVKANATPRDLGKKDPLEVAFFHLAVTGAVMTAALKQKSKAPFVSLLPRVMELMFHGLGPTK
jgi:AcrR family transcriptional regulator